ncbi:hypothetical protein FE840_012570 [Peteryoungia desertarenae]|uniref:Uncharacterized protein n=1 Tax=Peteryoungia desertarenae TaxID=1813451 RepID=A0ABX6QPA1_9HYPH|nr:hypothetical protein [Peteryoungia desertarenae]QLF70304.1 hypothetical protein FE840_012570 [Peteryoungia desertarenae]
MGLITWTVLFALVGLLGYVATRMAHSSERDSAHDAGMAIIEFGHAFPNEAIRNLHITADGMAVFVRLHDNKAGFMRHLRNHYACHLIEPGTVRVRDLPGGKGFDIEFLDAPFHNGKYTFASAAEAAEVSLWLLGNYLPAGERVLTSNPVPST